MKTIKPIFRQSVLALALGMTLQATQAGEVEDLRERVVDLEQRVLWLEKQLTGGATSSAADSDAASSEAREPAPQAQPKIETAAPQTPAPPVPMAKPAATPVAAAPMEQTRAQAQRPQPTRVAGFERAQGQIFLFKDQGDLNPAAAPDAEGTVQFSGTVSFDPKDYGIDPPGFLNPYDDPSLYPAVAVHIKGYWQVDQNGPHQLSISAKPAREGGTSIRSRLTFRVLVDGEEVIPETSTERWESMESDLELQAGVHLVEIFTLARSPGFGPSPTNSRILFQARGPGDAAFYPLQLITPSGGSGRSE